MTAQHDPHWEPYRKALPAANHAHRPLTITRRAVVATGVATAFGLARAVQVQPAQAEPATPGRRSAAQWGEHARASLDALVTQFRDSATGFYAETVPASGDNPWCYVWPYSQAMIASQYVAGIPGDTHRAERLVRQNHRVLEAYWNAQTTPPGYDSYLRPPAGQGGDKFYDDNEWIALGLIQRHLMSPRGDASALRRAAQIFDLVVHGWDTDDSHPCAGGVFWTQAPWSRDRNTVSNAPGAQVGLQLYLQTGQRTYLSWALRMYRWTRQWMLADNQLYHDHVDLAGNIDRTQWSYNQGVMIGAGILLHRATGQRSHLDQAIATADASLVHYAGDGWLTQPPEFNAIFFANLLQLDRVHHRAQYLAALHECAELYEQFRMPSGLYQLHSDRPVTLLNQAGVVRLQALAAWPRGRWDRLT